MGGKGLIGVRTEIIRPDRRRDGRRGAGPAAPGKRDAGQRGVTRPEICERDGHHATLGDGRRGRCERRATAPREDDGRHAGIATATLEHRDRIQGQGQRRLRRAAGLGERFADGDGGLAPVGRVGDRRFIRLSRGRGDNVAGQVAGHARGKHGANGRGFERDGAAGGIAHRDGGTRRPRGRTARTHEGAGVLRRGGRRIQLAGCPALVEARERDAGDFKLRPGRRGGTQSKEQKKDRAEKEGKAVGHGGGERGQFVVMLPSSLTRRSSKVPDTVNGSLCTPVIVSA